MQLKALVFMGIAMAGSVDAQEGLVEYRHAYDGMIRSSDDLADVLSALPTPADIRQNWPVIVDSVNNFVREHCDLEARGIPTSGHEMHPNDYEYTGGDEPSRLMGEEVRIIQMDNNLAHEYHQLFEVSCDAL